MRRLLLALAVLSIAPNAFAQATPPDNSLPPVISEPQHGLWANGTPRAFFATTVDLGYIYVKPRLTLGYGKPFWRFVALDVTPIATNNYLGVYGGVRFAIPYAEARFGGRAVRAFQHNFLDQRPNYDAIDLAQSTGDKARYYTLEAELSSAIPAGPGNILSVFTYSANRNVPADHFIYEEHMRVITGTWLWRARLGYGVRLGQEGNALLGVVGEVLGLPQRGLPGSDYVWRAGFISSFVVSEHLEALFSLVFPVWGPDTIGIAGGDIAEFGLRYRWATGTRLGI
ncbi:MAG: hypothetical protein ACXWUG_20210 [Polyangiales bacterium]